VAPHEYVVQILGEVGLPARILAMAVCARVALLLLAAIIAIVTAEKGQRSAAAQNVVDALMHRRSNPESYSEPLPDLPARSVRRRWWHRPWA
jgi:hypothetical protein